MAKRWTQLSTQLPNGRGTQTQFKKNKNSVEYWLCNVYSKNDDNALPDAKTSLVNANDITKCETHKYLAGSGAAGGTNIGAALNAFYSLYWFVPSTIVRLNCPAYDINGNIERWTNVQNECTGHRDLNRNTANILNLDLTKNKLIQLSTINIIYKTINDEIDRRQNVDTGHKLYTANLTATNSDLSISNISLLSNDITDQQISITNLQTIISTLNKICNNADGTGTVLSSDDTILPTTTDIIKTVTFQKTNADTIQQRVNNVLQDCVCYSDCGGYSVCYCYGNCAYY